MLIISKNDEKKLINAALKVMKHSHSPHSGFRVGSIACLEEQEGFIAALT